MFWLSATHHIQFSKLRQCAYVTMLRHPLDRLLSSYFYCQRLPRDQLCASLAVSFLHFLKACWYARNSTEIRKSVAVHIILNMQPMHTERRRNASNLGDEVHHVRGILHVICHRAYTNSSYADSVLCKYLLQSDPSWCGSQCGALPLVHASRGGEKLFLARNSPIYEEKSSFSVQGLLGITYWKEATSAFSTQVQCLVLLNK